ncbi:MAG: hypothetical protein K0Q56_932 [Sporolactobacillus laevolacticus]|jgi:hypothetical protein|nr:hypothetical protein [Sporolactobacillus laevolacticus]
MLKLSQPRFSKFLITFGLIDRALVSSGQRAFLMGLKVGEILIRIKCERGGAKNHE